MFALIPSPNERRRERSGDERERGRFSQLREDEEIGDEERKKKKRRSNAAISLTHTLALFPFPSVCLVVNCSKSFKWHFNVLLFCCMLHLATASMASMAATGHCLSRQHCSSPIVLIALHWIKLDPSVCLCEREC